MRPSSWHKTFWEAIGSLAGGRRATKNGLAPWSWKAHGSLTGTAECRGQPIRRPTRSPRNSHDVSSMARSQPATGCRRNAASPNPSLPRGGTVREALRSLSARGLVSRRVGSGTFVIYEPDTGETDVSEITSPLELVEVRAAIEPQMVRLAVRNATARDMAALQRSVAEMEGVKDAEGFSLADEMFHLRLAEATHNPLIVEIYHRINHVRAHQQWDSIKNKILTPTQIAAYNGEHRDLLSALARRDADRAVEVVSAHMERARADLMASSAS